MNFWSRLRPAKKDFNWLTVVLVLKATPSFAYPEMLRHGYPNCTSCHISPSGGGVLTAYGRNLSKEILSQFGTENETRFIDLILPPEHIALGGDFRLLQTYKDYPTFRSSDLLLMQADLEGAYTFGSFTFDATLGIPGNSMTPATVGDSILLRRHYLIYRPFEDLSFRVGKFHYSFGINHPHHFVPTRQGLSIHQPSQESYNLEAAWFGAPMTTYLTVNLGHNNSFGQVEKGLTFNTSFVYDGFQNQTTRFGFSYLYGSKPSLKRNVLGPYFVLCFSPKFFLQSELFFQQSRSHWGFANYQKLSYEWIQGFQGFLTQALLRNEFSNSSNITRTYGIGFQYFPRPHFEIETQWQLKLQALPPLSQVTYLDVLYLLFHIYL